MPIPPSTQTDSSQRASSISWGEKDARGGTRSSTIEEIFNLTKIDRWFLVQIEEIVDFEEELAGGRQLTIPALMQTRFFRLINP